ncbi:hypothetical protein A0H81_06504 [Grifola frondosa]|uniref:Uncharacterized protein n=1 Tax=Grifola frondosa TaxID=5627 RepID=A0A1C7M9R3_GRIFR|nr:hypothetical protein A0H81_06504 [Grifola frondosa]
MCCVVLNSDRNSAQDGKSASAPWPVAVILDLGNIHILPETLRLGRIKHTSVSLVRSDCTGVYSVARCAK